mmetsp:Transcript_3489/g.7664  ORF Transcript_3489/g.7664 Transcript_3489/m.7664 type:complete len:108 (-) Transcript_3489:529-852(-)
MFSQFVPQKLEIVKIESPGCKQYLQRATFTAKQNSSLDTRLAVLTVPRESVNMKQKSNLSPACPCRGVQENSLLVGLEKYDVSSRNTAPEGRNKLSTLFLVVDVTLL